jgi:RNA polymerase sigma-70 factor, ECF subfamily
MSTQAVARKNAVTHCARSAVGDERLLVTEAKCGHSSAFGELYLRHRGRIYRSVYRILRNRQDSEDTVQCAFQRAFRSLSRFREDSTFTTWVTRIAINEALILLRKRRAKTLFIETDNDESQITSAGEPADDRPSPEQALAKNELRATMMDAISRLRENLRAVVLLHEFQGLTSAETAQRLGLTVSTVKARTFHARHHLRKHLERKYKVACASALLTRN